MSNNKKIIKYKYFIINEYLKNIKMKPSYFTNTGKNHMTMVWIMKIIPDIQMKIILKFEQ